MKRILLLLTVCLIISCGKKMLIDGLTNKGTITTPILYLNGEMYNGICYNIFPNGI